MRREVLRDDRSILHLDLCFTALTRGRSNEIGQESVPTFQQNMNIFSSTPTTKNTAQ